MELPTISASCGLKRYMHYTRFILTKIHKQRSLNHFFLLDLFLFTWCWFFNNLQMTTEWAFAFLNTAEITFCLRYSLNISHQPHDFFLCKTVRRSMVLFFQFTNNSRHRHTKIILTFFSCDFTIVTADLTTYYIVCLLFPGPQDKFSWAFQVY